MKKSGVIIIISLVIIILLVVGFFSYTTFLKPNEDKISFLRKDAITLIVEDKIDNSKDVLISNNDDILMPLSLVKGYIDSNINWDDKNKILTITTNDKLIRMKTESLEAYVNNKPVTLNIPVTIIDGIVYIPADLLKTFYDIETSYVDANKVFLLDYINEYRWLAYPVDHDVTIRDSRSIKGRITGVEKSSDKRAMYVYEEYKGWYKVRTFDGILGYAKKDDVKVTLEKKNDFGRIKSSGIDWKPEKGKINLVWELISQGRINIDKIVDMNGLDVISPTWFKIQNIQGDILNIADEIYLKWAHDKGYQVWALVCNDYDNPNNTGLFLKDTVAKDNFIKQILIFASKYELDGINVDFENINLENKEDYVQFLRELTPMLHEQGLVVSVDVGVPEGSDNWSLSHDRKAIGEIVDYVVVMTYDQFWSTSPNAGSVAQYSWVENKIIKTLKEVPSEKLLLGIPNYISVWEESESGGKNTVKHDGYISVATANDFINKYDLELSWDAVSGQYYSSFINEGKTYYVWFEDTNSIDLKTSLILKYNLAGAATWKRIDSDAQIWQVYNKNLKELESYNQWQETYQLKDFGAWEE